MSKSISHQMKPDAYTRLRGCSPSLCRFLTQRLCLSKHDHVLDLGCGPGENTALMAGISGAHVEGLDLDPERIRYARASNPALTFHLAKAEELPFANESFSAMTMSLSVQRFQDRDRVFIEISRALVSGGRVAIATVSPDQLAARPDFRAFPTALRMECERFPAIAALRDELARHGFSQIEVSLFSETIRPLDMAFVRWLEDYPFSVLRRIPADEFRDGLQVIRNSIHAVAAVQLLNDEYTVITATKP